ncbi:NAD-dependent epimerase/dehydratase [Kosakonia sp.]|uniref:NAD-dependent epimerase/dehydratase n=1 Tax=Kosakonia sp. TaxID=1916651 RepID=UPI00289DD276|nr:NAD-dependent epimerase/dehydratase [Kosakonia sp.]
MKILVSGATGYLGRQLIAFLSKRHSVAGLCRRNIESDGTWLQINISESDWHKKVNAYEPDVIINTVTCYGRNKENLSTLVESNVLFPLHLLESVLDRKSVFINCGTSLPAQTNQYALTKHQFVDLAKSLLSSSKINASFVELKLEHFYGEHDADSKFTAMLIRKCLANESIDLTSGVQKRDFMYIGDLLSAFDVIIRHLSSFEKIDEIEVGSGEGISLKEFAELVRRSTGSNSVLNFGAIESRSNELMFSCANTARLNAMGWSRKYSHEDAIVEIVRKEKK